MKDCRCQAQGACDREKSAALIVRMPCWLGVLGARLPAMYCLRLSPTPTDHAWSSCQIDAADSMITHMPIGSRRET